MYNPEFMHSRDENCYIWVMELNDLVFSIMLSFNPMIEIIASKDQAEVYYLHLHVKAIEDKNTRETLESTPVARLYKCEDQAKLEIYDSQPRTFLISGENFGGAVRQAINVRLVNADMADKVNFIRGYYEDGQQPETLHGYYEDGQQPETQELVEIVEDGKTFMDVSGIMKDIGIDPTAVEKNINSHRIATGMLIARAKANLTQKDLAEKLGESVAWVKHVEEQEDAFLTLGEIERYYRGLGIVAKVGISVITGENTSEKLF